MVHTGMPVGDGDGMIPCSAGVGAGATRSGAGEVLAITGAGEVLVITGAGEVLVHARAIGLGAEPADGTAAKRADAAPWATHQATEVAADMPRPMVATL